MKSTVIAALLLAMATLAHSQTAEPDPSSDKSPKGRRLALVIGNEKYVKLHPLPAVPAEVELIRKALTTANFQVTVAENLKLDELAKTLDDFSAAVQPGDICFFYYSGYAAHDVDDDFLIPLEFNPAAGETANRAYPLLLLAKNLETRKPALKMFFLEAARKIDADIPDARPGVTIPSTSDLTEVLFGIPTGTQTVDTPPDQVGLFTAALAQMITRKGLRITDFMPAVLNAVMEKSPAQQPTQGIKVTRPDFYFLPPAPPPPGHPLELTQPGRRKNRIDREFYSWIPAGKFLMGCVPTDKKCEKDEKPQHEVTISKGFWMGENEVRVASYKRFVLENQKTTKRKMPSDPFWNKKWILDDHPISNVSWDDAVAYCGWAGGRLPTEAEWEYAARGGKQNEIYIDAENARGKAINSGQIGGKQFPYTAPVQQFEPNGFGLYDMAGNVWEFVNDWFSADYYATSPALDPPGPATGKQHVRRGGSFYSDPKIHLRLSIREPSNAENNVGFRCVMNDNSATKSILVNP